MTVWTMKMISEFCQTGSGGTPSRKEEKIRFYGGGIPWVKSGELKESIIYDTEETITEAALRETSTKMIPAGALLVAMYGATIGRVAILGIPATSNQAVCHIIPDVNVADQRYMFYALRQQVPRWLEQRVGGAQPNISQQIIRNTPIPLPPIEEQRRIAAILDQADAIRRKRQEAIRLTEELLRATFLDMFGDPVTNPKGWEIYNIDQLCKVVRGSSPRPKGDPRYYGGNIPRLMVADLTRDGWFVTPKIDSLTPEGAKLSRPVNSGTIVMVVSGNVGEVAKLKIDACVHDGFVAFTDLNKDLVFPDYFLFVLHFMKITHEKRKSGAIWQNLTTNDIKNMAIPLPPYTRQLDIDKLIQNYQKLNQNLERAYKQSENLFNSLLQRAFRGEL